MPLNKSTRKNSLWKWFASPAQPLGMEDADEDGVGEDGTADALQYLVATKAREVRERKLWGV